MLADLESDVELGPAVAGADAVVFAAGAGPGSGCERKRTMDLGGAVKPDRGGQGRGHRRYVIVSSMGAGDPVPSRAGSATTSRPRPKPTTQLRESGLDYTIVRPGA